MDDSYCLLPERISEQFSEIDSDIVMDLAAASPEYTELKAQMEELKRQILRLALCWRARENFLLLLRSMKP